MEWCSLSPCVLKLILVSGIFIVVFQRYCVGFELIPCIFLFVIFCCVLAALEKRFFFL